MSESMDGPKIPGCLVVAALALLFVVLIVWTICAVKYMTFSTG